MNYLIKTVALFCVVFSLLALFPTYAQEEGVLKGKVTDINTGKPLPFVNLLVLKDTTEEASATSDFDGDYKIGISADIYNVKVSALGFTTKMITNVEIKPDKTTVLDISMEAGAVHLESVEIVEYRTPLIEKDGRTAGGTMTRDDISKMPARSVSSKRKYWRSRADFSSSTEIRGSREDKSDYFIDGVKVENLEEPIESAKSGVLTAGKIHDFSKWNLWKDISGKALRTHQNTWQIKPMERYAVQVVSLEKRPVIDARVELFNVQGDLEWASRTDNTGKAELWANLFEDNKSRKKKYLMKVHYKGEEYELKKVTTFSEGLNMVKIPAACDVPDNIDVCFVVDATGSMGDEIEYLKTELSDIIQKVKEKYPLEINLGSVFYRDTGDDYITRKADFSSDISQTIGFIKDQRANGGGDFPEAVDAALDDAVNGIQWSENARSRLLFLILDAPPHHDKGAWTSLRKSIREAALKGIRVIPITASGIDKSTEYLMRSFALATNGNYIFLTDHSGVGNPHIKPTTDKYDVQLLNDLLVNLLHEYLYVPSCNESPAAGSEENQDTMFVYAPIIDQVIIDSVYEAGEEEQPVDTNLIVFNAEADFVSNDNEDKKALVDATLPDNNSVEKKYVFKYFPNPTRGILHIETDGKSQALFLADISGKLLRKYDVKGKKDLTINLDDLPNGIYFLRCRYENNWLDGKVILTH